MKHENPKIFMDSVKICLVLLENSEKCTENENYKGVYMVYILNRPLFSAI